MLKKNEQKKNEKEVLNNKNLNKTGEKSTEKDKDETKNLWDEKEMEEIQNELGIKDEKIKILESEISDYKDKVLRQAAEFENYKRRTENDQLNILKYSAESFIIKLLSIVDDFERSLAHINNAKDVESIRTGIKLVYDKMMKMLDEQGVKTIESVGKAFDVDYHEALMQRKDDSVPDHTILDEIEKGYIYKDKVIRHAKVIVSEASEEESENSSKEENLENKNGNEDI